MPLPDLGAFPLLQQQELIKIAETLAHVGRTESSSRSTKLSYWLWVPGMEI
jgi:hypothetical protein